METTNNDLKARDEREMLELVNENPRNKKTLDKELFKVEYESLRNEILQRITQQTNVTQISFTAWAAIIALAIKISDSDSLSHIDSLFNTIYIILVYPLLAFFISFSWAFHNSRICKIGNYLRDKEEQASITWGDISWERFIYNQDKNKDRSQTSKIAQGLTIFFGTQIASILLALIILFIIFIYSHDPELIPGYEQLKLKTEINVQALKKSYLISLVLVGLFLLIDIIFTYLTYKKIKNSEAYE